jgi:hypothetical protein
MGAVAGAGAGDDGDGVAVVATRGGADAGAGGAVAALAAGALGVGLGDAGAGAGGCGGGGGVGSAAGLADGVLAAGGRVVVISVTTTGSPDVLVLSARAALALGSVSMAAQPATKTQQSAIAVRRTRACSQLAIETPQSANPCSQDSGLA